MWRDAVHGFRVDVVDLALRSPGQVYVQRVPSASATMVDWAFATAELHLQSLPRRWSHVQAVAALASAIGPAFPGDEEKLEAAAVLHDVGYSQQLADTGFHPLDGARYLRLLGREDLAGLVAHHSGARIEARLRGLDGFRSEFAFENSPLDDALTFCDLTTGPTGHRVRLHDRVTEIQERYGPNHIVSRAIGLGVPDFERAVAKTEARMVEAGVALTGSLAYPS